MFTKEVKIGVVLENNKLLLTLAVICIIGFAFKVYTTIVPDFSLLCSINSASCMIGNHTRAIDFEHSLLNDGGIFAFILVGVLAIKKIRSKVNSSQTT